MQIQTRFRFLGIGRFSSPRWGCCITWKLITSHVCSLQLNKLRRIANKRSRKLNNGARSVSELHQYRTEWGHLSSILAVEEENKELNEVSADLNREARYWRVSQRHSKSQSFNVEEVMGPYPLWNFGFLIQSRYRSPSSIGWSPRGTHFHLCLNPACPVSVCLIVLASERLRSSK